MSRLARIFVMWIAMICFSSCATFRRPDARLERTWYSSDSKACLTISRKGYSQLDELHRVRVKQRRSEIAVFVFSGDLGFRPFCETFHYNVQTCSDSLLVLTQDPVRNDYFEYLQDSVMRFVPVPRSHCGHDPSQWAEPLDSATIRQLMLANPPQGVR